MGVAVNAKEPFLARVGVNLCGGQGDVPQELFDGK
jgi:hypothetical protein